MELRQLEYFVTTAEELHFGRAAARMDVTQPSLTQQIKRLERELGVVLFDRDSHTVRLTPAGSMFHERASAALESATGAIRVARHHGSYRTGSAGGWLRIGFVCSATRSVLPDALRRFQGRNPGAMLTLKELWTGEQLTALAEDKLDLAFVFGPVHEPELRTLRVAREPFVVLLPKHHPLARRAAIDIRDLGGLPLALFQRELSTAVYDRLFRLCAECGVQIQVSYEVPHPSAIPLLVAAGRAVGLASAVRARRARISDVVMRPLIGMPLDEEVHVVWRADGSSRPVADFLASVVPEPMRLAS